jgi:hypothetical protein
MFQLWSSGLSPDPPTIPFGRAAAACPRRAERVSGLAYHKVPTMSETPPDRLATNPDSPFYDEALLTRGVGIRFKGVEKTNVDEYCVSEGWVKLSLPTKDRRGNPLTVKLQGPVEPYFRGPDAE